MWLRVFNSAGEVALERPQVVLQKTELRYISYELELVYRGRRQHLQETFDGLCYDLDRRDLWLAREAPGGWRVRVRWWGNVFFGVERTARYLQQEVAWGSGWFQVEGKFGPERLIPACVPLEQAARFELHSENRTHSDKRTHWLVYADWLNDVGWYEREAEVRAQWGN